MFLGEEPHKRTYLVQVNNILGNESLRQLQTGTSIRIKGGINYTTPPCDVMIVTDVERMYQNAVTKKGYGPHTWLLITLTEGKYHQVRKMIGAVRHRCKRLIRLSIEDLPLNNLAPGAVKEIAEKEFFDRLHIGYPR